MQATTDPAPKPALASIDLHVPGSDERGRAFVPSNLVRTLDLEDLRSHLGRCFIEEDDEARMSLLRRALAQQTITFETFPGETPPVELHAYVRAPQVSDAPIFACVLVSLAVVEHLVSTPPHVVLETATLQVIGDDTSPASVIAGLQAWMRRVWPGVAVPKIRLNQWPDVAIWSPEVPALTVGLPRVRSLKPMTDAPAELSRQEFIAARQEAPPP